MTAIPRSILFPTTALLLLVAGPAPRAEARTQPGARLVGLWRCTLGRQVLVLGMLPNGRFGLEKQTSRYRVAGNTIQVYQNMSWVPYPFRLHKHRRPRKDRLQITLPNHTTLRCARLGQGKERQLHGMLCAWSGSSSSYSGSSYSRTTRVYFDGRGWFRFASESSFSSGSGSAYGQNRAKLGMYRVVGNKIVVAFPDGTLGLGSVHMRQSSGRITEVKYGGRLFAAGLCK